MQTDLHEQQAIQILNGILDSATRAAAMLAEQTVTILQAPTERGGIRLTQAQRRLLQQDIRACLDATPSCNGAGFASHVQDNQQAPGYWTLEWWFKDGQSIQPSQLERSQETRQRLDFRTFAWFDLPARQHLPCLDGPYVDYVCNGDYTITAAHPVLVDGNFAGVAAVDVLVSTLDRLMQQALSALARPALVLNPQGRVVLSTAPGIRTGTLWRDDTDAANANASPLRLVLPKVTTAASILPLPPQFSHPYTQGLLS